MGATMLVFYRGRRALITQQVFETIYIGRMRYAIEDLTDVHIVRFGPGFDLGNRLFGFTALVAAFLVVPIVGPVSEILTGLVAGVLLVGSVLSAGRRLSVRWELVAIYRGQPVTLFESADQTEFDQVRRGLQRALERNGGDR
ncbi:DUF6232 family protein [Actinoplanes sp. NPDC026619]|uniref:DUF6232 family protein n=1 Tax=Actinoplanes sp. NPDC026619 TaxID=3155798 RepID=UPI0033D21C8E